MAQLTDTAPSEEAQRAEILASMLSRAQEETGKPVRVGDIVHQGNAELDAQMIVSGIKEAGVSVIYDTRTGERSLTNNNMLKMQLSKKRPDGSLVFTNVDPGIVPVRGQHKCMLHPDLRKEHPEYDEWGLLTCMKESIPSRQAVKAHMMSRHKREWETIESERIEKERQEDREIQRANASATLAALNAAVGNVDKASRKAG